jgi:hypothetical protein
MTNSYGGLSGKLRPTDLIDRPPTRNMVMEEFVDSEGVTRYKLVPQTSKFTDETKAIILAEVAEHGRLGTACRKAGVTMASARKYVTKDPEFGLLFAEALEAYKDRLITHHQDLVFNGTTKVNYDRNGGIVSEEKVYPIRLIELELKKHDEGYRDKKEMNVNVRGGVLVAPAEMSMEDWEKNFSPKDIGEIVDADAEEVFPAPDEPTP